MKKKYVLAGFTIIALFFILTAGTQGLMESSGMFSNTGSPGDGGSNCSVCHGGGTTVDNSFIATDIGGTIYVPGQTYTVTLTIAGSGSGKKGFSIVCEDVSKNAVGTFVITDATNTQLFTNHVSHKLAGTSLSTWSMDWTAPPAGTGDVTFYAAFVKNGKDGGVVTASSAFLDTTTSIRKIDYSSNISLYPNPVDDILNIDLSGINDGSVSIFSITGQLVLFDVIGTSGNSFIGQYDLRKLNTGTYLVKVENNNQIYTKKIIVI